MTPARRGGRVMGSKIPPELESSVTRPRLFVELCCGSAAVTLKLLGGRYAVPPISYMGSKRGYAHAILWAMGLQQGQGAGRVLLCDAGPWGHVWGVLADRDRCLEVASIIRGWKDEDPRQLWERLRDEHRGEWDGWTAERVAGWALSTAWSGGGRVTQYQGPDRPSACHGDDWVACIERDGIATRLESVAAWLQVGAWSGNGKHNAGFCDANAIGREGWRAAPRDATAKRLEALHAPISVYPGSAADIEPPDDCDGVYVYMDPPYQGTTGYSVDLPREDVLAIARKWSDAGAVVCISEAEPLDLDGWHHQEITSTRQGQKRTFSKQQREWLTLNREPAWRPAVQREMFP